MAKADRFAARNSYVKESLDCAVELLRTAKPIEARLGDIAIRLADILDATFIPQIRTGDYHFPKDKIDSEAIPVFSLATNEAFEVIGAGMTPSQIRNFSESMSPMAKLYSPEVLFQIAKSYSEGSSSSRGGEMRMKELTEAFVNSRTDDIELGKFNARILGRPVMALAYQHGKVRLCPDVVVHEAVHLMQRLEEPLREFGDRASVIKSVESELEAYHYQALFIEGLDEIGYTPVSGETTGNQDHARSMERFRIRTVKPGKPFGYTKKMRGFAKSLRTDASNL